MPRDSTPKVRNLAVLAHVDHGKTSLVDALIAQARMAMRSEAGGADRFLEAGREKTVRQMPRYVSLRWRDHVINLVDTPGQADLEGKASRVTRMVEGLLFVVDGCEGPAPRSRHVLRVALSAGLRPVVAISKIDLPGARPDPVLAEIRDQFADLEAGPAQLSFPFVLVDAVAGRCRASVAGEERPLAVLLDRILEDVPPPAVDPPGPARALVTDLDYDDFLGRLAIARVFRGRLERSQPVVRCGPGPTPTPARVGGIYGLDGLERIELRQGAGPGEIVQVAGLESVGIGDTLADPDSPDPLPPIRPPRPVVAIEVSPNDSPLAELGKGTVPTERLRERLWSELLTNPAIRVKDTGAGGALRVVARGELQLAILIEMMRREGFELSVSRPTVDERIDDGVPREPMERLTVDCPDEFAGVVTQKVEARLGRRTRVVNRGSGRVRLEFVVPARGLLGFRTELLADTRGRGFMNHEFDGWAERRGEVPGRATGSLVADRPGRATAWAIEHLQHQGTIFVAPGDEVYAGMVVGEHARPHDLDVNIVKEPPPAGESGRRPSVPLIPPQSLSLERALEFVRDDERVEVTPRAIRLKKHRPKRRS